MNSYLLFQTWEEFAAPFRPPKPNAALLTGEWQCAGLESLVIAET